MELQDITVEQFIKIWDIVHDPGYVNDETQRTIDLLVLITGKTEEAILSLTVGEFNKQKQILTLFDVETIRPNAKKTITANGNIYKPIYNITRELKAGQLVDVCSFVREPERLIYNIPSILASMCLPTRLTVLGRRPRKYLDVPHTDVVEDMKKASIVDAYGIAVFFWNVWNVFLQSTGPCLVREMIKKTRGKMTPEQMNALLNILSVYGDGIAAQKKLQRLSESL